MVEDVPAVMPSQVEVGMLGQVDQGGFVCRGINQHLEYPLFGHDVGDTHLECAWVSLQKQTSDKSDVTVHWGLLSSVERRFCENT